MCVMADVDAYQVTLSALSKEDGGGFLAEVFELPRKQTGRIAKAMWRIC